ncbi:MULTISPECIES: hypothetical protein [unclassified Streptomyces]|uniref:hypothetical protein n=1 Tax=unclassified Streptomyces TaxID=2593676 RepID=UPI002E2C9BE6|nr:hypothetical protein [Streptomyces sp. NBC_00223]
MNTQPTSGAPAKTRTKTLRVPGASRPFTPAHVPYIARWSGERDAPMPVVMRKGGRGIGYADERSLDRDGGGVLWSRTPSQPGRGTPEFGKVHSLRQRIAMAGLRCQICGGPADRNRDGVLWLVDAAPGELSHGAEYTSHPPVCRPCAHRSVHACPHLRTNVTALRVRDFAASGVNGVLYHPARPVPVAAEANRFDLRDPRITWVRAYQTITTLRDFTVIDLDNPTA